ncbi:MAG: septal ring lytic transglycosylase RlpA family protein [Phormidesmis sp.]
MDLAPALPPSQESVPALVSSTVDLPPSTDLAASSATDESTVQLSFLPTSSALASSRSLALQTIGPSTKPLPAALMVSIAGLDKVSAIPAGFLSGADMAHSFSFVGQVWRLAHAGIYSGGSIVSQPRYSATVPIQWASRDRWQANVLPVDIQVKRVKTTTLIAQLENHAWSEALTKQCLPQAQRQIKDGAYFKVSIGDQTIGYVANENRAYLLAQQLKRLVRQASFNPEAIAAYPIAEDSIVSSAEAYVGTADQPLFSVDDAMAKGVGYSADWAAIAWANNLRLALAVEPLSVGETLKGLNNLEDSRLEISGEASWYGPYFHGRATANGETYNQNDLTVAHKSLPFGTQLQVRNLTNDKTVVVRVNDRGPYVGDRILDLSKAAADCLESDGVGVVPVEATILKSAI